MSFLSYPLDYYTQEYHNNILSNNSKKPGIAGAPKPVAMSDTVAGGLGGTAAVGGGGLVVGVGGGWRVVSFLLSSPFPLLPLPLLSPLYLTS